MSVNTLLEDMRIDLDKYLAEYLEKDFAIYSFDLIKDKGPKIKVRTISLERQMEVEAALKELSENEVQLYRMHTYQIKYLSQLLLPC